MNQNQIEFHNLNTAGYFRKSTDSEDRQILSIPAQILEMTEICNKYGIPNIKNKYQESRSAKKEGTRLEFLRLEKDILNGSVNALACWKLDRLARNMREGGKIIDWLSDGTLKCIITNDKIWFPTDNVLAMAVEFGQGKQYVKDLSVNVKRGLRAKYLKGFPSGVAPTGFKNTPHLECGQRYWTLDEARLPLVKKAFEMFLTGTYSGKKLGAYCRDTLKLTTLQQKELAEN